MYWHHILVPSVRHILEIVFLPALNGKFPPGRWPAAGVRFHGPFRRIIAGAGSGQTTYPAVQICAALYFGASDG